MELKENKMTFIFKDECINLKNLKEIFKFMKKSNKKMFKVTISDNLDLDNTDHTNDCKHQ